MFPCSDQVFPCRSPAQVGAFGPVYAAMFLFASATATCRPSLPSNLSSANSLSMTPWQTDLLEQFDTERTIAYVHGGLRGHRANASLGPRDHGADRKVARGDGHAPVLIHRIVGDDRKRRDIISSRADPGRE